MDRELLLELGCEELPASWLPGLTAQIGDLMAARLAELRLAIAAPVDAFSTPRRLTVRIARVADRQTDLEELITGPPVAAAFGPNGEPTAAALGFARKQGVEAADLEQVETPKGRYLAFRNRQRGKAAVDVLPQALAAVLRDLSFPKLMRWDAVLDDGRGEFLFGRPIRWILFLYGGRVVPFGIRRTELAQSGSVQEVRSAATTYGHRFLTTSGRAGRAIKVRTFEEYRARLLENFVVLERAERHDKIARELDAHARRLGGRVSSAAGSPSGLLQEVSDLVEYPSVIAGTFAPDFLALPEEVLTTTMIHHQHYFPVVNDAGRLMPAFLAVTNTQADNARVIARNTERVLTARLRDAQFFWETDRKTPLEQRVDRLETILFHKTLGTYRAKAERIERDARRIAAEVLAVPQAAGPAALAARLAKADLTTELVREFTELQGTMGGVYARQEGLPEEVWKAIYYHYLPVNIEKESPPTAADLGRAAVSWAAVALADKVDTVRGLFGAGERPTGSRDPFALRRLTHGIFKILVDLPELTGLEREVTIEELFASPDLQRPEDDRRTSLSVFLIDRLRFVLEQRGFSVTAVRAATHVPVPRISPLRARRMLEALEGVRGSDDFAALAVLFKRVRNIARELPDEQFDRLEAGGERLQGLLTEPAELALLTRLDEQTPAIARLLEGGAYKQALVEAAAFRPLVDRFFTEVFVMVDDERLRTSRLRLMKRMERLILQMADISEIAPESE